MTTYEKYLFVPVPEGTTDVELFPSYRYDRFGVHKIGEYMNVRYWLNGKDYLINLPCHNYQLIGLSSEIEQSEVLAATIVEAYVFAEEGITVYKNYNQLIRSMTVSTAADSFRSLMQSLNLPLCAVLSRL